MKTTARNLWMAFVVTQVINLISQVAHAQTYQFSQYYNSFQLLNPSYTGISGHKYRFGAINRVQWLGVPSQAVIPYTTMAMYGHWVFAHPSENSAKDKKTKNAFYSAGAALIQNNQASGQLRMTTALVSVSWIGRLGELTYLSGGAEANYNIVRLNEYVPVSDYLQGINVPVPGDQVQYPNFSLGLTLIHKRIWLGASLKDILSTPIGDTFYSQQKNTYDQLNIHGGFSMPLMETDQLLLTSSFSYKTWQNLKQLEAGLGIIKAYQSGYSWSTTFAYRGFPIQEKKLSNSDALIFILGFNSIPLGKGTHASQSLLGNSSITISSDFYNFQFGSSFSTWEISLFFHNPYKKKRLRYCEDYLHGPLAEQITRNFYSGTPPYKKDKNQ